MFSGYGSKSPETKGLVDTGPSDNRPSGQKAQLTKGNYSKRPNRQKAKWTKSQGTNRPRVTSVTNKQKTADAPKISIDFISL